VVFEVRKWQSRKRPICRTFPPLPRIHKPGHLENALSSAGLPGCPGRAGGTFEDELRGCKTDEERQQKALEVIAGFGDVKMLAVLLRRAKKRCRPLWRTVVARTFQIIGPLLLCLILYTIWFSTGKPTISVDYLAMLNRMSRPEVSNKDNAWPHLEKAASLYIDPNQDLREQIPAFGDIGSPKYRDFAGLPEADRNAITEYVRVNERAWGEFIAASSKPYCCREYGFDPNCSDQDKRLWSVILPHLPQFRGLARVGLWRCRIDIAQAASTKPSTIASPWRATPDTCRDSACSSSSSLDWPCPILPARKSSRPLNPPILPPGS